MKINKRFRKKGDLFLTTLLFVMGAVVFLAAVFTYISMVDTGKRAQNVVDTVANTRAQAIDIPLKEEFGFIEVLHRPTSSGYKNNLPKTPNYNKVTAGYDQAILNPTHTSYRQAVTKADTLSIETGLNVISNKIGTNNDGEKIIDAKQGNFCIVVDSIPTNIGEGRNFNCLTTVNGKTVNASAENVYLRGTQDSLTKDSNLQIYNAVFVAFSYEDRNLFYSTIQGIINGSNKSNWDDPPIRTVWAVSYPQIDATIK